MSTPWNQFHLASRLGKLEKGAAGGGFILSFGGEVSPGTPVENIDALVPAARA
jgi:uroporphyrinogen-III decarboxylase